MWGLGARIQDVQDVRGLRRSRLYEHLASLPEADWQHTEELIRWGQTDIAPRSEVRWVVDTRKMLVMSQFQDFGRLARWETMALVRRFLKQAVVESAIAEHSGIVSREHQQTIEREAEELLKRMPWGQLEMRLFEQGGWGHKDSQQRVMYVSLKPFRNPLLQRACELLCEHLNQHQPVVRCQDGEYTLRYACQASPLP